VLPKVFETYRDCFPKESCDLLAWVAQYCPAQLQAALVSHPTHKVKYEREELKVLYPCQQLVIRAGQSGTALASNKNIHEQMAELQPSANRQHQPQAAGSNDRRIQQHVEYALEYRGDLSFQLPSVPPYPPPLPPVSQLTSVGLPAFIEPAR
jgi:hypothetical protein